MLQDMKIRFLAKKDVLYQEGDKADGFYIIERGKLIKKVSV